MTSGVHTIGAGFTPFYYRKAWSGPDGKYELHQGHWRHKWNNYTYDLQQQLATPGFDGSYMSIMQRPEMRLWSANEQLDLLSKLAEAVKGHQFNLGVAVGEGKATIKMLASTASTLATSIRALRRGNFTAAARALSVKPKASRLKTSDVSGRWLELQYGWMPFLSDVYESAKAFEAIANGPRTSTVRAKITYKQSFECSQQPTWYTARTEFVHRWRLKHELVEEISVPRSLGLLDPLVVAWELVPFSFVADWFFPFGDYLENLSFMPFLTGRTIATKSMSGSAVATLTASAPSGLYGASCNWKTVRSVRENVSSLTPPAPAFKGWPKALSPLHVKNAVALVHQAIAAPLSRSIRIIVKSNGRYTQ